MTKNINLSLQNDIFLFIAQKILNDGVATIPLYNKPTILLVLAGCPTLVSPRKTDNNGSFDSVGTVKTHTNVSCTLSC